MNLALALMQLYPTADPLNDFLVRDDGDGNGPYLAEWNLPDPQPSQAELEAAWVPALRQQKLAEFKGYVAKSVVFKKFPDYKQWNAALGIYDAATSTTIKNWVIAVRAAVDEVEAQLLAATTETELEAVDLTVETLTINAEAKFAAM